MPIDIDELLQVLPTLIRENDTVKGAIISALSGVVATHEDVVRVIEEMDKRFEAMQAQMDKRFEAMQAQMDKRFEAMDKRFEAMDKRFEALQAEMNRGFKEARRDRLRMSAALDSLGSRAGPSLESAVLELMDDLLVKEGVDYAKVEKINLVDHEGAVFFPGYSTDVDVLAQDGETHLFEVKFKADQRDAFHFLKNAELFEHVHHRHPDKLYLVTLEVTRRTLHAISGQPVVVIAGTIVP